jgi:hypothetical protein
MKKKKMLLMKHLMEIVNFKMYFLYKFFFYTLKKVDVQNSIETTINLITFFYVFVVETLESWQYLY